MDRSWMKKSRLSKEYELGVEEFISKGFSNTDKDSIRCPCQNCGNLIFLTAGEIRNHLYTHGICQSYSRWIWHGEEAQSDINLSNDNLKIGCDSSENSFVNKTYQMVQDAYELYSSNPKEFEKVLNDADKPLFPNCRKFTKLSALVRLYSLKARYGWSDISFSELLKLISELLPEKNEIPLSTYEAKKTLNTLGMEYEKIHACPNDCCLYRNEFRDSKSCPHCGLSRWKSCKTSKKIMKGVPSKVLWYFPPIPRFRRMFQNAETAEKLLWHDRDRIKDGMLRHPADSESWKFVDQMWPNFKSEPRNLRLAISADGINPHGEASSKYSCWPVLMVTYNLSPWLCMQRNFIMLTLLISGPKQPGNDIDTYLAPLIDDLKLLWNNGIDCYDAYQNEKFTLRAILLWTINDFPAYGNLCGCSVKGYNACPICGENTYATRMKHSKKMSYMGHRRFLPTNHIFRRQKKVFNGQQELGIAPEPLSGEEILSKMELVTYVKGKRIIKGKRKDDSVGKYWKKRSIFFDLEYWKSLLIRHCLDVMHIEKNVCMNIIGTLLDIPGKTKDGLSTRKDLEEMKIRAELAPVYDGKRTFIPPACYTLSREEKRKLCEIFSTMKVSEGYSSNIRNLVSLEDSKLYGLKSYDCHVLMQQLLPVAIRSVLPKHVKYAITRLCLFFNHLCNKVLDPSKLDDLQKEVVVTLCLLEKYFPPSFFTIMMHLVVHLVREVKLCGPVNVRWMYPFERYMKVLKSYVRNRNKPEGCMSEGYIVEEAVDFCTQYLSEIGSVGVLCSKRLMDSSNSRPTSSGTCIGPDRAQLEQAHRYVLENTIDVEPYITLHMQYLKVVNPHRSKNQKWLQDEHNRTFIRWLQERIANELQESKNYISQDLRWIAHGPQPFVWSYDSYIINGCHFTTKKRDAVRSVQNSGVSLVASTMQVASAKDKKPVVSDMSFYGVIQEIWELDYNKLKIPMFKCDWVENYNGVKVDEYGLILVDLQKIGHKLDSFIMATQAKQIFYIQDPSDIQWSAVIVPPQKDIHEDHGDDKSENEVLECHQEVMTSFPSIDSFDNLDENVSTYIRTDCDGIWINN